MVIMSPGILNPLVGHLRGEQIFCGKYFSFFCDPRFTFLEFIHLGVEVFVISHDIECQPFDFFQIINPDAKSDWNDDAGNKLEFGRSFLESSTPLNTDEFFQSIQVSAVGPLDY